MKISIRSIGDEGLEISLNQKTTWLKKIVNEVLPVEKPEENYLGRLRVDRADDTILVAGDLTLKLHPICDRCAEESNFLLKVPLKMTLIPRVSGTHAETGDMDIDFYEGEEIDVAEVVREKIFLSLPSPLLCKASCKGRCPQCQKNLNLGLCSCVTEWVEEKSPFASLGSIQNKKDSLS